MVWRAMLTPSRSDLVIWFLHEKSYTWHKSTFNLHGCLFTLCNATGPIRNLRVLHRKDFEMTGILTSIIMILLSFKRIVCIRPFGYSTFWVIHDTSRYPMCHDIMIRLGLMASFDTFLARTAEDEQTLKERHQPWPSNIHRGTCLLAPQKSWSLLPFLKGSMLRFTSCKTAELFEV